MSFKKYVILTLFIFPVILLPVSVVLEFRLIDKDKKTHHLIKAYKKGAPPVFYFGDSVNKSSPENEPALSVSGLLEEKSGQGVYSLNHNGYSPIIYKEYIKLFRITEHKPKVVVFGLNMRSFSMGWNGNPSNYFTLDRIYVNSIISNFKYLFTHLDEYMKYRFLEEEKKRTVIFKKRDVGYENLGKVEDVIEQSRYVVKNFRPKDESPELISALSIMFRYHYLYRLTADHEVLQSISEMKEELDRLGIQMLVYITPINFRDGNRFVGERFEKILKENVTTVMNYLEEGKIRAVDHSTLFDPSYFFDKDDVCEHLVKKGKVELAEILSSDLNL